MRLGRWELIRLLGRGGMGEVWLARDPARGEDVAIKLLLPGVLDPDQRLRFERETQVLKVIRHPGLVAWIDRGEEAGRPWVAMEVLPGGSLLDLMRCRGPLPVREAVILVRDLASALTAVHQAGVVHRDLKPSNVLFDAAGTPRLTDFGLALPLAQRNRLTATGALLGSPGWLTPEQVLADREQIGPATDVYALGAVLFYLLVGRPPFPATLGGMEAVLRAPPPGPSASRPEVGRALDGIVRRCLAKSPADRFPNALALRAALDGLLAGSRPPGPGTSPLPMLVGAGLLVLGVVVCAAIVRRPQVQVPAPPQDAAVPESDIAPPDMEALFARAAAKGNARDHRGALEEFERLAQIAPDDPRVWYGIASGRRGLGDVTGAEEAYERILALEPKNLGGLMVRGEVRYRRGDVRGALEDLDRVLTLDPDHAEALVIRSERLHALGEHERALRDCEQAIRLAPDPKAYFARGGVRRSLGDEPGALADYDRALELDPAFGRAFFARGELRRARGELELALRDLDAAIDLEPDLAEAWVVRGIARGQAGDARGLADIDRAIALRPGDAGFRIERGSWHLTTKSWG